MIGNGTINKLKDLTIIISEKGKKGKYIIRKKRVKVNKLEYSFLGKIIIGISKCNSVLFWAISNYLKNYRMKTMK